jgi:glucose-6-phosphate 1-dehydrogenase
MDRPAASGGQAIDAAKVALLRAIRPLRPSDVVRGQYRGYRADDGVAPDSRVETYVAARVAVDNARWAGVPFWIRTGKGLAATFTEVHVTFKEPAHPLFESTAGHPNEICFRLSPEVSITLTAQVKAPGEAMRGEDVRLVEQRHPGDEMEPYERLLGDALRGERTLFGSEAGVEAAWRVVDPILASVEAPHDYDRGSWGPAEAEHLAATAGGWIAPDLGTEGANRKA